MTNPGVLIGSQMKLSFFNAWTAAREIREGETMMFSGRVGIYRGEYTLTNPHYALLSKDASGADVTDAATAPVPVYRAPVKLPTDRISGYMAQLLEKVPLKELEDPVPYTIRRARKVPSLEWTYRALHTPDSEDTWRAAQAQMRYREAFVLQSALARLHSVRAAHLTQPRPAVEGGLADRLLQVLPYELTEGQQKVGAEIAADLSSESPMNRLLQGDVGSGKTVVALRAMLQVADAGGQSAMLAPTEVLAEQHLRSVLDILGDMAAPEDSDADDSAAGSAEGIPTGSGEEPCRVRVRLLTASMGTRAKRKVLQELADGTAQIVIGTHALLSDEVSFHDLGLVVVDEQHRFGVEQRDGLRGTDGALPHRLVMTATPIPRTVAMTVFGDLDVSVLDTLPAGRQKISTHVVPLAEKPAWASRLWRRAREEIDAGHQVYVVVPKIGEDGDSLEEGAAFFGASSLNGMGTGTGAGNSAQGYFGQGGSTSSDGKVQLTSVASMYSYLSAEDALVGVRIGTLHGRMDPAEKTAVMTAFERGEIDLLISTTVIEVGVNVPNATLMIIMDADRFGISGLHHPRGRVVCPSPPPRAPACSSPARRRAVCPASAWMRSPPPRTALSSPASTWRSAVRVIFWVLHNRARRAPCGSCGRSPMPTLLSVPARMPARWWRRTRRWLSIRLWRVRLTAPWTLTVRRSSAGDKRPTGQNALPAPPINQPCPPLAETLTSTHRTS